MMTLTRTEWDELLVDPDVDLLLEDVRQDGILGDTFPELGCIFEFGDGVTHKDLWAHTKTVVRQTKAVAILRWAALFHDVGKPASFKLVKGQPTFQHHEGASAKLWRVSARRSELFTKKEIARVSFVVEHLGLVEAYSPEWSDSACRRLGVTLGDRLEDVFAVARADVTTARPEKRRRIQRLTSECRKRVLAIRAQDALPPALPKGLGPVLAKHLGLALGPEVGERMQYLVKLVEAGELPRNAEYALYLRVFDW